MTRISEVAVIIPAKDEQQLLPRCLRHLEAAAAALDSPALGAEFRRVRISVTVVLDDCTDDTAAVLNDWPRVNVVDRAGVLACAGATDAGLRTRTGRGAGPEGGAGSATRPIVTAIAGNVGAARHLGVGHAIGQSQVRPERLWIASTDADSMVPPNWLTSQLEHARSGAAMVVGTVSPDPAELDSAALDHWLRNHQLQTGHGHIHGANLGVLAHTYLRAGGFRALASGEDADLVDRVKSLGVRWVAADDGRVVTSARLTGRAPRGFAHYLHDQSEGLRTS